VSGFSAVLVDVSLLAAAVLAMWLTGVAIAGMLLRGREISAATPRWEWHGLALLLGIGGVSWLSFVWSLCGGPLGRAGSISIGLTGGLAGGVTLLIRRRRPAPACSVPSSPWSRAVAMLLLCVWISLVTQTLLTPQRLWDERAIFGIKSAVLFEDATIASEALRHPQFVQGHPRYPLLLPLAEEYLYGWLGRVDDRWGKLVAPLVALGLWLVFSGVWERHVGRDRSRLGVLLLASVPALATWDYGYLCVQADALVAGFHGLSVLYLWDAWRQSEASSSAGFAPWIISGVAAGLCLFTKDEGIALALVDGAALVSVALLTWIARRSIAGARIEAVNRRIVAGMLAWTLPILLIAIPWFWWRRQLPTTNEMAYLNRLSLASLVAGAATLDWSVPHLVQRMFGRESLTYGLMWWGVALTILLSPRRVLRPSQLLLLLDIFGAVCALLIAGMLAPLAVEDHIGGSSHRFLLQLIPTAVLFLIGPFSARPAAGEVR
jgi:hypothetical protein